MKFFSVSLVLVALLAACAPTGPADPTTSTSSPDNQNIKNMTFDQIIRERYSCKRFDPTRQISDEQLQTILQAGRVAPTAKNLQEQHIYVVQSADMLSRIDSVSPCRYGAPTCLVVAFDADNVYTYPNSSRDSGIEDATIVATHMLLSATALGINSCWINCLDPNAMADLLGLPANEKILMMLDLGFAAEGAAPLPNHYSRKELSETVTYL